MSDAYIPTVCPVHDFHSGTCSADCPDRVGWADLGTLVSNVAGMPELVCAMKDEITASAEMVDVWQTLARKILEARAGTDIGVEDSVTTALVYLDSLVDEAREALAKVERSRDSWKALADSAVGLTVERDAALARAAAAERERDEAQAKANQVPGLTAALDEARWERDVVLGREPAAGQALAEIARLVSERDRALANMALVHFFDLARIEAAEALAASRPPLSPMRCGALINTIGNCISGRATWLDEVRDTLIEHARKEPTYVPG